jgi:hypothetical protein
VSAAIEESVAGYRSDVRIFSDKSGVVSVGEALADVVTDEVVMPISVVVTTVSINGDESAVKLV